MIVPAVLTKLFFLLLCLFLLVVTPCQSLQEIQIAVNSRHSRHRRHFLVTSSASLLGTLMGSHPSAPFSIANAYTPDADAQQEALYLLSRVQEATVLQERYIRRSRPPLEKMKLSLRLVDKSYKVLDQVTLLTKAILDSNDLIVATQRGNEAADRLQETIDFVNAAVDSTPVTTDGSRIDDEQRQFVQEALQDTRRLIFDFEALLEPVIGDKIQQARRRVEEENKLNTEEFDPDLADEKTGIYDPIILPWKLK